MSTPRRIARLRAKSRQPIVHVRWLDGQLDPELASRVRDLARRELGPVRLIVTGRDFAVEVTP